MLTQKYLKSILTYSPEAGTFHWKVTLSNRAIAGSAAGCETDQGYWHIYINGKNYKAHRLAWLWMRGYFPKGIDHRDSDRKNNKWLNLREADQVHNMQNLKRATKRNLSGLLGVETTKIGTFVAKISVNKKRIYLGTFATAECAHKAYIEAKERYHAFYEAA